MVRYHISGLFIFTDLLSCAVHQAMVCCGHMHCCVLLRGAAARYHHPGVLPVPYATFTGLLPGLAVVLPRSCGECVFVATHNPGRHVPFPGI
jgi:hypothetical protein